MTPPDTAPPADPAHNLPEFTVGELSSAVKREIEGAFPRLRVRGEISQPKFYPSGCYFTLKDENAAVRAVFWKARLGRTKVRPEEGMEVIATGRVTTYLARTELQLDVESIELAGEGALLKLLEDRKRKLGAEGLFDADRKRAIPFIPDVIGVVTSPSGAVIRDILHRLADRFPRHVLIWPVPVQGERAAAEVARAIAGFNALKPGGAVPRPDVLIVARGGGSLEDLMPFNEEVVVRAAAASQIPLISAVGHETDTTLIDFASDRRAPTPTAAAEMAVPVRADLLADVAEHGARLLAGLNRRMDDARIALQAAARGLGDPSRMLDERQQRMDEIGGRLPQATLTLIERKQRELDGEKRALNAAMSAFKSATAQRVQHTCERLEAVVGRLRRGVVAMLDERSSKASAVGALLESYSVRRTLERGFALVRDGAGQPVLSAAGAATGDRLAIEFADGALGVRVEEAASTAEAPKPRAAGRKRGESGGQGSLL
jgi:exodeoxyribonuclease VII large subunit